MQRRDLLKAISAGPLALALPSAHSQTFPDKPIRVVVPFAAGNTLDTALRQVAEVFKANTGQPLIVDAKPGGSGIIAAQNVMNAAPDGYTLLLCNTSMFTINPHTFSSLPYDPDKNFKPVTNFLGAAMVMAVNDSVPARNVAEFVTWAKANPGKVSYASFTAGNSSHFAGIILNQRAGIDMLHVPFNGTPPAVTALLSGTVNAAFVPMMAVKQHVESGKLKVLAITTPKRSEHMPTLATFREQGYPDMDIFIWAGIAAPANTPDAVIARLNTEFTKALGSKQIKDQWYPVGFEPLPTTPQEFKAFYQAESKRWAEAVKISGFKATS
ncbi:MAG: tripartite tricarboxylate transporter substrate binding protein [Rhodoferax sp.]|nr:tripartite tricarboxylate transporter substrate binding protein [Rhodoferax sp.]MBP9930138.1 tripartite tricarboxylate transporter substrate binding protein [Rhodoferax sp.]HQX61483.1 tripartite tricarboxylate transporter substrate binding protein [Burkholderiaceae bacterium]HRA61822.1 tripartite tricarboxylate transporter substrate binding protein [Burkholderiaceae bacterium]